MGANADPSGGLGGPHRHPSPAAAATVQHGCGGGGGVGGGAASTAAALRHDPGLAVRWSPEEQALLEEGMAKYASDSAIIRYAKIAMSLPDKTVRDVALRCRWINKKETGKKRKEELAKKSKDKKERVADSSTKGPAHLAARPNVPPYTLPVLPMDDDDVSYKAIDSPTGQLLEHNAQILNQIYTNISNMQEKHATFKEYTDILPYQSSDIQENLPLLCQTRDNILAVVKEISDVPEIMKQMPPLPVKLNEDLANSILPRPPHA